MLNGTLLGHTAPELEARMDAIVGFAEIGSFMDAPLRTYSSGMAARLGFAVATAWEPEILLVDEVLAVGKARMQAFRDGGTTVLLVTHDMATVAALCASAAWLEHGKIQSIGPAAKVIEDYRAAQ
jgi:ABC-type polysaccharide/polyol phosphate transport system ATPase subunit